MPNPRIYGQLAFMLAFALGTVDKLQAGPFEPDDTAPYLGAPMDGAQADFEGPANPALREGNEPIWLIRDRNLSDGADLDWQVFYTDRYPFVATSGRIRIYGSDSFSQANLRVEVLGYPRDVAINPGATPIVLQSCGSAPTGTAVIELDRDDLRSFYRVRSCNAIGGLNYEFEYRFTSSGFGFAPSNVNGTVVDVRNGHVNRGAYVFSSQNGVTFTNPDDGRFEMLIISETPISLNFLTQGLESLGAVNLGAVPQGSFVDDVVLTGQPAGMIFFSGFEP